MEMNITMLNRSVTFMLLQLVFLKFYIIHYLHSKKRCSNGILLAYYLHFKKKNSISLSRPMFF